MTRGIAYLLLSDPRYAQKLLLSLYTLRQHWKGDVTIFCSRSLERFAHELGKTFKARHEVITDKAPNWFESCRMKVDVLHYIGFDKTVYLDCDTLIHGAIDELFPVSEEMVLVPIRNFFSDDPKCNDVYEAWQARQPDLVAKQKAKRIPLVNAGVMGLPLTHEMYAPWCGLIAETLPTARTPDETALQLLYADHDCRLVDHKFNWWPGHGQPDGVVINHYYLWPCKMAVTSDAKQWEIWQPFFRRFEQAKSEVFAQNLANCREWPKMLGGVF